MQKAGRMIGRWLRKVVTSDGWRLFQQTSREIQTLPNRLMREAALDELREVQNDLRQPLEVNKRAASPTTPSTPQAEDSAGNNILPPAVTDQPAPPTDDEDRDA